MCMASASPSNRKGMFTVFSILAEVERGNVLERQCKAIEIAKTEGNITSTVARFCCSSVNSNPIVSAVLQKPNISWYS